MQTKRKKNGSYYTPPFLAEFILRHVSSNIRGRKSLSILEPSVGDGAFIRAFASIELSCDTRISFTCVEKVKPEIDKAKLLAEPTSDRNIRFKFECVDFLRWQGTQSKHYSIILGNPPYIKKSLLNATQINSCKEIHESSDIAATSVKNIWSSFLIRCTELLEEDGILAFVLPAELLQAKFANPIRDFLRIKYDRIELFTFNDLLFDSIGQDTVILIGYKKAVHKGVYYTTIKDKSELENNVFVLSKNDSLVKSDIKWTHHILTGEEIELLSKIKSSLKPISYYCSSKPGIVTAANKFFIIDNDTEKKYRLGSLAKPIIQKGIFVNGSVVFDRHDLKALQKSGLPAKFLMFEDKGQRSYSKSIQEYLRLGVKGEIHKRFKSLQRARWFVVPNVSTPPEGFFFKRCHQYPKLLKNNAGVYVTDSAYEIAMHDEYDIESLIYSFYNSLSLCFAEMEGRYYGGGVLELTPKEFKKIPVPYKEISQSKFKTYTSAFEVKSAIKDIFEKNDSQILAGLSLTGDDVYKIQSIRQKLIDKRLRK
jgi:adenine-specific DNA-methyltransferase